MSREFNVDSPGSCSVSGRFLTKKLQLSRQKTVKILKFCDKNNRISFKEEGNNFILNCPKLKDLSDNWTQKLLRSNFEVPTKQLAIEEEVEEEVEDNTHERTAFFEEFWNTYNKKIDKVKCEKWYSKNVPNKNKHDLIMLGIKNWKDSGNWDDKQFQPYPMTFLNNKRWEDEPPEKKEQPNKAIHDTAYKCKVRNPGCRNPDISKPACKYCKENL